MRQMADTVRKKTRRAAARLRRRSTTIYTLVFVAALVSRTWSAWASDLLVILLLFIAVVTASKNRDLLWKVRKDLRSIDQRLASIREDDRTEVVPLRADERNRIAETAAQFDWLARRGRAQERAWDDFRTEFDQMLHTAGDRLIRDIVGRPGAGGPANLSAAEVAAISVIMGIEPGLRTPVVEALRQYTEDETAEEASVTLSGAARSAQMVVPESGNDA